MIKKEYGIFNIKKYIQYNDGKRHEVVTVNVRINYLTKRYEILNADMMDRFIFPEEASYKHEIWHAVVLCIQDAISLAKKELGLEWNHVMMESLEDEINEN